MNDSTYMDMALRLARQAARRGEVPVGAVVVHGGRVIATASNNREASRDLLGHAEVRALRKATRVLGNWRLNGASVYVTLEPCPMCIGTMLQARVDRVVFGATDPLCGAAGSVVDLADYPGMSHHVEVVSGVRASEAAALLEDFFRRRRKHGDLP